jgi:hypothetical protein
MTQRRNNYGLIPRPYYQFVGLVLEIYIIVIVWLWSWRGSQVRVLEKSIEVRVL